MESSAESFGGFRSTLYPIYRTELLTIPTICEDSPAGKRTSSACVADAGKDHLIRHAKIHDDFMAAFQNMDAMFHEIVSSQSQ